MPPDLLQHFYSILVVQYSAGDTLMLFSSSVKSNLLFFNQLGIYPQFSLGRGRRKSTFTYMSTIKKKSFWVWEEGSHHPLNLHYGNRGEWRKAHAVPLLGQDPLLLANIIVSSPASSGTPLVRLQTPIISYFRRIHHGTSWLYLGISLPHGPFKIFLRYF